MDPRQLLMGGGFSPFHIKNEVPPRPPVCGRGPAWPPPAAPACPVSSPRSAARPPRCPAGRPAACRDPTGNAVRRAAQEFCVWWVPRTDFHRFTPCPCVLGTLNPPVSGLTPLWVAPRHPGAQTPLRLPLTLGDWPHHFRPFLRNVGVGLSFPMKLKEDFKASLPHHFSPNFPARPPPPRAARHGMGGEATPADHEVPHGGQRGLRGGRQDAHHRQRGQQLLLVDEAQHLLDLRLVGRVAGGLAPPGPCWVLDR